MSETWLKLHVPDNFVYLPGYQLIRRDRKEKEGGGIGLYVRNGINITFLASPPRPKLRSI